MPHWQWGSIMFMLTMVCYYLTDRQQSELILSALFWLFLGGALSTIELYNEEKK